MPNTHKWSDLKRKKLSPVALKKVEQEVEQELLEMDLRYLREMTNMTQSELAELLEMTQSEVSRLENRSDGWRAGSFCELRRQKGSPEIGLLVDKPLVVLVKTKFPIRIIPQ